jgi:hypothetical protein
MILNKLREQKHNPDPELLKEMGWSKDDLAAFLDRWEQMKEKAEAGDVKDRRRYEEALKSIGLDPDSKSAKSDLKRDGKDDFKEDSAVIKPPQEILPGFKAFQLDQNRSNK